MAKTNTSTFYKEIHFRKCSYFVAIAGSVSMETVKNYIEGQYTDEHKRKYENRSKY